MILKHHGQLIDKHGRTVDYLRIGVTDRCNLRCRYCMPEEGIDFSHRDDILTYEEIVRLANIFCQLGVKKVRLTGGEPFARKDIGLLIHQLSQIFEDVRITTNATLLHHYYDILIASKIGGLNISLDSLDRDKFFMITRRDEFDTVMDNINKCCQYQLPFKVNVVAMKGVNDMEICDFILWGMTLGIEVRFIEAMPFNEYDGNKDVFMSIQAIKEVIESGFGKATEVVKSFSSSSQKFALENGYEFGIIPAYTRSMCGTCNRIRLTPKGELLNCLYSASGTELISLLRDGHTTDAQLANVITESVFLKLASGHDEQALRSDDVFQSMTSIGG